MDCSEEDKEVLTPWRESPPSVHTRTWPWRLTAALLILGSASLHIAYLAVHCPLDLVPDEAHYWDWSRHPLQGSYYSKGPLIAYLIHGGCVLFGSWSQTLTGGQMLAVRLPAVLCGSLLLVSLYVLTVQVFRRESLACAVVALALTLPVIAVGSSLMTIDAPYTCCWGWALVLGYYAVTRGEGRGARGERGEKQNAPDERNIGIPLVLRPSPLVPLFFWLLTGLVVGLGILAKYTMVLWIPSFGLFLLTSPQHRRLLLAPGFWIMTVAAGLCCLPILFWNFQNGWISFHHVNGLAGTHNPLHWEGPFVYVGVQCALLLGFWFFAWLSAMIAHRPWREADAGIRYLWWMSAPMFLVFLLFSVKTAGGEPNWPITAYISGLVLMAGSLVEQLQSDQGWRRRLTLSGIGFACILGLGLTVVIHRADLIYPVLARFAGAPTAARPMPLRKFDPSCRLRGWRTLGAEVDRLREKLHAEGIEPILAAANWSLPGEVGFYCAGRPLVYSLGLALGDRHSQYDLWRPNPIVDVEMFRGRTFLMVGASAAGLQAAFDHVETPHIVVHQEQGQPIASWAVTVCRGFHGFPRAGRSESSY